MVGDSSLSSVLRALTCLELYSNSDFYLNHPIFNSLLESNTELFSSKEAVLSFFLSNETYENDLNSFHNYIKEEAQNMCKNRQWASHICIMALSTVINCTISVSYPDFGYPHYKAALSQVFEPRQNYQSGAKCCNEIKIIFCNSISSFPFVANHFVPLLKRKKNESVSTAK